MSFMADLRDAIHGFHFTGRKLSQLPTLQAAQITITEQTALFLPLRRHQRLFWKYAGRSQARRLKDRRKFQTCGT